MTRQIWHKIEDGKIVDTVHTDKPIEGIADGPDGNPVWRQQFDDPRPEVRNLIESLTSELVIEPSQVRKTWTLTPKPMPEVLENVANEIDKQAEGQRFLIGNTGTSKQAEYDQAAFEADQWHIGAFTTEAEVPLLQADVQAKVAVDLDDASRKVREKRDAAKTALAAVRLARREAKGGLNKAADQEAAWSIFQGIVWPK